MFVTLIVIGIIIGIVAGTVPMDFRVRTAAVVAAIVLIAVGLLGVCGLLPLGVDRPTVIERREVVR